MRIISHANIGQLSVGSAGIPEPGEREVLIRVAAAGINRPDLLQSQGKYPPPPGASPVLGMEVAGEITALGPHVERWCIGDNVCALVAGGGYAEYCAAPGPQCLPIPGGLTVAEAAALPETFFTVWTNVFERGRLQAGERILIHGGSSGIGTVAIQLARAFGASVVVTAGSAAKCDACLALGAELAINYRERDFVEAVGKVNVILDMIGGSYFQRNLQCLATDGRLVQIAIQQGSQVELDLMTMMKQRLTISGSTLRPRSVNEKGAIARELETKVWPLLAAGIVKPVICKTFPLEEAQAAFALMTSSQHIGKIVLTL